MDRLAVVEGFQLRQFLAIGFQQVRQLQQQALAVGGALRLPAPLEGPTCGVHRQVDIGLGSCRDLGQLFATGGVVHRHPRTAEGRLAVTVDQQAMLTVYECSDTWSMATLILNPRR